MAAPATHLRVCDVRFRTSVTGSGGPGDIVLMPAAVAGQGGAVLDGVLERVTFANPETGYTIARIAPEGGGATWSPRSAHCSARRSASSFACAALVHPPEVRPAVRGGLLRPGAADHRRQPVSRNRDPKADSADERALHSRIIMHWPECR